MGSRLFLYSLNQHPRQQKFVLGAFDSFDAQQWHIHSPLINKSMLFCGDLRVMTIWYLAEADFEQNLKLCKTCRKVPVPESFFNLQPATLLKKDTGICISLWKLAQYFTKNFIMENLLRTGFERRILQKMPKRHSYYKDILYRRQLFQKTDILRQSSGRASSQKLCLMIS